MARHVNYSVLHFATVRWAREIATGGDPHWPSAAEVAVVFGVMTIEALVNEQALIAVARGHATDTAYRRADSTRGAVSRIQALLELAFGAGIDRSQGTGQDLGHLMNLRNCLVHFRFNIVERDLLKTLRTLSQRDPPLFHDAEEQEWPFAWPNYAHQQLAHWAAGTTSGIAMAIADLNPRSVEADRIRRDFAP